MEVNSEEFFKKYGFTQTKTKNHPVYGDMMEFKGLEADYVGTLEREVEHYKRLFMDAMLNNERLMHRESYRLQDEIEKLKRQQSPGRTTLKE